MKLIFPFIQFFIITIIVGILCISFRYYQRNFIHIEYWLDNLYKAKDYINEMPTNKQRLIILSGSNSLFGFNGEIIDKNTKFRPINYATHAGLPLNYQIDRIMQHAKNGDIIFIPLEFNYYIEDAPRDNLFYISNMLYWGNGYRKYISNLDIINDYIKSSKPTKSIEYFLKNIFKNKENLKPKESQIDINIMNEKGVVYDYRGLNFYGDFCTQQDVLKESDINESYKYMDVDFKISNFFISEFKRLESWAKKHNIKLFLTYPTTIETKYFS